MEDEMTLDDLGKTFINSVSMKLSINPSTSVDAAYRAGIRAVVEVLRDEICERYGENSARDLANEFNDILGCAEPVKNAQEGDNSLVCDWTDRGHEWVSSCKGSFGAFASTKGRFFCPSCNKPIKFNAAA